jgi:hypothetical protein
MADACVFLMNLPAEKFDRLLGCDEAKTGFLNRRWSTSDSVKISP